MQCYGAPAHNTSKQLCIPPNWWQLQNNHSPKKNVLILKTSRQTSYSNPKCCIALIFNYFKYIKYNIRKLHHWFWHHLILFPILKETSEDAKYVLLLNTVWFTPFITVFSSSFLQLPETINHYARINYSKYLLVFCQYWRTFPF